MATSGPSSQMDPSAGGGGSNWERNIHNQDLATAKPVYNTATGQWMFVLPDGTPIKGTGSGQSGNSQYGPFAGAYQNDPNFMPPGSLQNNDTFFGDGGGGSDEGVPGGGGGGKGGSPASLGKRLFDSLIGRTAEERLRTGLNLAGNLLQSRQVSKATQAQVDAANRSLALQRDIYLQQRSDLMPYADMGRGAIGDMGRMTGTTPVAAPTLAAFSQPTSNVSGVTGPNGAPPPHDGNPNNAPVTGQAVPRGSLSDLAGGGDFVNMFSPDGKPARVPRAQMQQALAAGGRMA